MLLSSQNANILNREMYLTIVYWKNRMGNFTGDAFWHAIILKKCNGVHLIRLHHRFLETGLL
jgi:hypothetical protein